MRSSLSTIYSPTRAAVLAAAFGCVQAHAEWNLAPVISADTQHSSNFQLLEGGTKDSALTTTIAGELGFANTDPINRIKGSLGTSFTTYSGADQLEDTDRLFADVAYQRRLGRGRFGVSGAVRRDDQFRQAQPNGFLSDIDNPAIDIEDDLGIPSEDSNIDLNVTPTQVTRTNITGRTFFGYRLNERQQLRLSYGFTDRSFNVADDEAAGISPRDSKRHAVQADFTRNLSETSRVRFKARVTTISVSEQPRAESYEARAEWSSQLSEGSRITTSIGASHVTSDLGNSTGLLASIAGESRLSWGTVRGSLARNLRPTIRGNINESDQLSLSVERALAPRWYIQLSGNGARSDATGNNNVLEEFESLSATTTLGWRPIPRWSLSLAYQYRWIDREFFPGNGEDHSAIFTLQYRPTGLRL